MKAFPFVALVLALASTAALPGCGGDDNTPAPVPASSAAVGDAGRAVGDAARAEAGADGAEREGAPDTGLLDRLPEEGVGSQQVTCPPGPAEVSRQTLPQVSAAVLCLHNAERTSRGLKPLRTNAKLARAASAHAKDMVAKRYFAHDSPDGRKFSARIRAAGYMAKTRRWSVGENLAWGGGALAVPAQIMDGWLASPPHKANMLDPAFREVGFGVVLGTPRGGEGATYAAAFGVRR